MKAERVLEIINNTRVPERKRKFWPQCAAVFVNESLEVVDVIQYESFDHNEDVTDQKKYYPGTVWFLTRSGMYSNVEELEEKITGCEETFERMKKGLIKPGANLKMDNEWVQSGRSKIDFGEGLGENKEKQWWKFW